MNKFFDNIHYLYENKHNGLLDIKLRTDINPEVGETHTIYKIYYEVIYKSFSTTFCKDYGFIYNQNNQNIVEEMMAYCKSEVRRNKILKIYKQ